MKEIYSIQTLKSQNFFHRLFKSNPKENAFIEINNLLATKYLREIMLEEISEVCIKYKINLREKFLENLKELYERYLKKCLEDNMLTDEEVDDLTHLRQILALQENEVMELHNKLGGEIYKRAYNKTISDGKYETSEEEFIDKLQKNLRLPNDVVNKISDDCRKSFMDIQVGKIVEDGKISPDEWNELTLIAKNLNVNITIDTASKEKFERLKLNWLIENGELPVKHVDINLQKSEQCYYSTSIDWLELRRVTKRVNYSGPTYRMKIAKGFYYRVGSISPQRITSDELQVIDRGTIYITNKRLIFCGRLKNSNIALGKILSITPYSDGVGIEKDSGKSPIFRVLTNADILAMVMARVIKDINIGTESMKSHRTSLSNEIDFVESNFNALNGEDGKLIQLIELGKMLEAVKYYKEKNNLGLAEAKKRVDEIRAKIVE